MNLYLNIITFFSNIKLVIELSLILVTFFNNTIKNKLFEIYLIGEKYYLVLLLLFHYIYLLFYEIDARY